MLGWLSDASAKIAEIHATFVQLKEVVDRLREDSRDLKHNHEALVDKLRNELDGVRSRVAALEANFQAMLSQAVLAGCEKATRAYLEEHDWGRALPCGTESPCVNGHDNVQPLLMAGASSEGASSPASSAPVADPKRPR